jgi:prepilin-type N-terminal cleavage/methylation domain-containing protein
MINIYSNDHMTELRANAFTLIELLIVAAIIGILVSLAFPVVSRVRTSAKTAAAHSDMGSVETAVNQYYAEYRRLPFASVFHGSQGGLNRTWRGMTEQCYPERLDIPGGAWHHNSEAYTVLDSGRLTICTFATLQGSNQFEGEPTGFNPRETQFLQIQEGRPIGHFMDPWSKGFDITADPGNRLYSLLFDHNLNGVINVVPISNVIRGYRAKGKLIVVTCYGENRTSELSVMHTNYDDLYTLDVESILMHHGIRR